MGIGKSTTKTDSFDLKAYAADFLFPADEQRFYAEPFASCRNNWFDPRDLNATQSEIRQGYKITRIRGEYKQVRIRRLTDNRFQIFRANIERREGLKVAKKWILTSYPDGAFIRWFRADFDRHFPSNPIPEDILEVEDTFWVQVAAFKQIMDEVGFEVAWTTSPGHLNPLTGECVPGAYAWVKLDTPMMVSELRSLLSEFQEYHSLECEISFVKENNHPHIGGELIRQAGQRYVEACAVDVENRLITAVQAPEQPADTFITFAKAWEALHPISADDLFCASRSWFADNKSHTEDTSVYAKASDISLGKTPKPTPSGESAQHPTTVFAPSSTQAIRHPDYSVETVLAEPNTFVRATSRLICSRLARKYLGNKDHIKDAVKEGMQELKAISLTTSKTCSNPQLLEHTMTRWMKWYFDGFKISKMKGTAWAEKEQKDLDRFRYSSDLDISIVLPVLKKRYNLTFHELSSVKTFYSYLQRFKGRLAARFIYGDKNSLFSRKTWFTLKSKLDRVLIPIDERDVEKKKCTQWAFSKAFVADVNHAVHVKQEADVLLREVEEKKEKRVYVTPCSPTAAMTPQPTRSGCLEHHNENIHDEQDEFDKPWLILTQGHCALT